MAASNKIPVDPKGGLTNTLLEERIIMTFRLR